MEEYLIMWASEYHFFNAISDDVFRIVEPKELSDIIIELSEGGINKMNIKLLEMV